MTTEPNAEKPNDTPQVSPGGSVLYQHTRRVPFEMAIGDHDVIEAVSAHIEAHIGTVESVWHELISDLVHIDVHHVKPTAERPYHTLVTSGMSQAPMTVPEGVPWNHAELLCVLPPEWTLTQEAFKDRAVYWPIEMLKRCARLPHEYDTWLGPGHTVPNGDPAEPFAPGTSLSGVMITWPLILNPDNSQIDLGGKKAQFLMMVPLNDEEMAFKLQSGSDVLEELIDQSGLAPWDMFRPNRPSVIPKWRGGRAKPKKWWWPF